MDEFVDLVEDTTLSARQRQQLGLSHREVERVLRFYRRNLLERIQEEKTPKKKKKKSIFDWF